MSVLNNLKNIKDIYCNGKRIKAIHVNNKVVYLSNEINPSYNYLVFNISSMGNEVILSSNRRGDTTNWNGLTDWGDGTVNSELTHTYTDYGFYTVKTKLMPEDNNTKKLLIECKNVNKNITDAHNLFSSCENLKYVDMSRIKDNNITDMSGMFNGCINLIELNVGGLNTSNVTTMNSMFSSCYALSTDISHFDVSNVTDMRDMFFNAKVDGSQFKNWRISNVEYMTCMFFGSDIYNDLDLSTWDVSNVKSFMQMFAGCHVNTYINISNWNNILDYANTSNMFYDATKRRCAHTFYETIIVNDCDKREHFVIHDGVPDELWEIFKDGQL